MNEYVSLVKKIKEKRARIGIIGLGYVGLPLALLFAKEKFQVTGFVRTAKKKKMLDSGKSHLSDVQIEKDLKASLKNISLQISIINAPSLQMQDIIIVCVPTPVSKDKTPDLTDLINVGKKLEEIDVSGKLIINESTVASGTTLKIFGHFSGKYFLVCSPERVDPGIKSKDTSGIPKVIGGQTKEGALLAKALYSQIIKAELVIVSSPDAAELSKMLENTYRAVNIALVNEFAKVAEVLGIDILEVIRASSTKWSFQPHYPGIGVGGHCIPVDPYYLLSLAKSLRVAMPVVKYGLLENERMPEFVAEKVKSHYKKGMKVLVYGITYKKDVNDLRESAAIECCHSLSKKNIAYSVFDPLVTSESIKELGFTPGRIEPVDILVVGTDHKQLAKDYKKIVGEQTVVIDGKNFFVKKVGKKIIGIGRVLS